MAAVPDLVRDSRLETRIQGDVTCHRIHDIDPSGQERAAIRKEYWKRTKRIGGGGFGSVFLEKCVKGEKDLKWRALKEIPKADIARNTTNYNRELEALAKFSQPRYVRCFVRSLGWFESEKSVCIAMEYFPLGDLAHYLAKSLPLTKEDAQPIVHQLLEGLSILHENGFAHRDLKPGNILIQATNPWWVKIGDFGISKRVEEGQEALSTVKGTLGFMAPELLSFVDKSECCTDPHGAACATDIWAIGEMTFQMLTKQPIFANLGLLHAYTRDPSIFPANMLLQGGLDEGCVDLLRRLAYPSPSRRPTAHEAMNHTWLTSYRPSSPKPASISSHDFSDIEDTTSFAKTGARTKTFAKTAGFNEPSAVWSTRFPSEEPATIAFNPSGDGSMGLVGQHSGYFGTFGESKPAASASASRMSSYSMTPSRYEQSPPQSAQNSQHYRSTSSQFDPNSNNSAPVNPTQWATPERKSVPQQPYGYPSPPATSDRNNPYQTPNAHPSSANWQTPDSSHRQSQTPATWTGHHNQALNQDPRVQTGPTPMGPGYDLMRQSTSATATWDPTGYHGQVAQGAINTGPLPQQAVNESAVREIETMGFARADVEFALRAANNNPDQAVNYLIHGFPPQTQTGQGTHAAQWSGHQIPPNQPNAVPTGVSSPAAPPMPERSVSMPTQPSTQQGWQDHRANATTSVSQLQNDLSGLTISSEKASTSNNNVLSKGTAMMTIAAAQVGDLAFNHGDTITVTQRTKNVEDYWLGFTADGRVGRFPGYAVWLPPISSTQIESNTAPENREREVAAKPETIQYESVQQEAVHYDTNEADAVPESAVEEQPTETSDVAVADPADEFESVYVTDTAIRLFRGNPVLDLSQTDEYIQKITYATFPLPRELTTYRYTAVTAQAEDFIRDGYVLRQSLFAVPRSTDILITIHIDVWPNLHEFSRFFQKILEDVSRISKYEDYADWVGPNPWKTIVVAIVSTVKLGYKEAAFIQAMGIDVQFTLSTHEGQPYSFFDDDGYIIGQLCRNGQHIDTIGRRGVTAQLYECTTKRYVETSTGGAVVRSGEGGHPVQLVFLDDNNNDSDWTRILNSALEARVSLYFDLSSYTDGSASEVPKLSLDTIHRGWQLANKAVAQQNSAAILYTKVSIDVSAKGMNTFATKFKRGFSTKSRKNEIYLYFRFANPTDLTWEETGYEDTTDETLWCWSQGFLGYVVLNYKDQDIYVYIREDLGVQYDEKCLELTLADEDCEEGKSSCYLLYFESTSECEKWAIEISGIKEYALKTCNPSIDFQ